MAIVINGSGTVTGLSVGGLPDGSVDNDTVASGLASSKLTGALPAVSGASLTSLPNQKVNDNLIINGDFAVSQRGDYTSATSASNDVYYLDRFAVALDQVSGTIQDTGFAAKLVATSSATGTLRLRQKFEEMSYLSGKTVTISCQMKSNDANSRINVYADGWQSTTATHTGGGAWETISITLTLPSGITTELSAHFGIDGASSANVSISSGDYCEVKDCKMELGSVATPFQHRPYGEELALCQRYYQKLGGQGTMAVGAYTTSTRLDCVVAFPVEMRTTPSLTLASGTNYWYAYRVSAIDNFNSWSGGGTTKLSCSMYALSDVSATAGVAAQVQANNANAFVTVDAEL